jgi:hypothetical protein
MGQNPGALASVPLPSSTPATPASNVPVYDGPECDTSTLTGTANWLFGFCTPLMAATEAASQNLGPGASAETVQTVIASGAKTYSDYEASLPSLGTPSPADACGFFQTWDTPTQTCVTSTTIVLIAIAAVALLAFGTFAAVKR